jgi:hypothetical protein
LAPAKPPRMNEERHSRAVSSRAPRTSPIAALFRPESESRNDARTATARFAQTDLRHLESRRH